MRHTRTFIYIRDIEQALDQCTRDDLLATSTPVYTCPAGSSVPALNKNAIYRGEQTVEDDGRLRRNWAAGQRLMTSTTSLDPNKSKLFS